jgi:hypothetical protein
VVAQHACGFFDADCGQFVTPYRDGVNAMACIAFDRLLQRPLFTRGDLVDGLQTVVVHGGNLL